MSNNKDVRKAKHNAFEKKEEEKGRKVVNWIFGVLVALAVLYMIYSLSIMS